MVLNTKNQIKSNQIDYNSFSCVWLYCRRFFFPSVFVLQYKFVLTKLTQRAPTSGARTNVLSETREIFPDYSGVRVALTLVCFLCAMFCRLFFIFYYFFFFFFFIFFFFFFFFFFLILLLSVLFSFGHFIFDHSSI